MLCLRVLLTDRNHSKTLREILFDAVGKNRKVLGKPYGNGQRSVTYGQCSMRDDIGKYVRCGTSGKEVHGTDSTSVGRKPSVSGGTARLRASATSFRKPGTESRWTEMRAGTGGIDTCPVQVSGPSRPPTGKGSYLCGRPHETEHAQAAADGTKSRVE